MISIDTVISTVIPSLPGVIAAIATAVIGKQFANRRKLQEKLLLAQRDIEFLLVVEEEHCALHVSRSGESYKNRMRQKAKQRNFVWSGKFTPGRANDSPTLQKAKLACA